jgi:hypothetical protein
MQGPAVSGGSGVTWLILLAGLGYVGYLLLRKRPASARPFVPRPSFGGKTLSGNTRFRNPLNGYEEEIGTPWIWCLLFGCIYFAARGVWTHAVAAALLAVFTVGLSWLIYPAFARGIIETHYLRKGWQPV